MSKKALEVFLGISVLLLIGISFMSLDIETKAAKELSLCKDNNESLVELFVNNPPQRKPIPPESLVVARGDYAHLRTLVGETHHRYNKSPEQVIDSLSNIIIDLKFKMVVLGGCK